MAGTQTTTLTSNEPFGIGSEAPTRREVPLQVAITVTSGRVNTITQRFSLKLDCISCKSSSAGVEGDFLLTDNKLTHTTSTKTVPAREEASLVGWRVNSSKPFRQKSPKWLALLWIFGREIGRFVVICKSDGIFNVKLRVLGKSCKSLSASKWSGNRRPNLAPFFEK